MIQVVVIGGGMMGRALAWDLARQEIVDRVKLLERDPVRLKAAVKTANSRKVLPVALDISDPVALRRELAGSALAIGAVSYHFNEQLCAQCIESGVHFLDLGGNDRIVDAEFAMHRRAAAAGVTVFPDCGLAPGLAGIIGMHVWREFERTDELHLRVGGLPQRPRPPLDYQLVFSVKGLVNEYKEPVRILADGRLQTVPGMSGLERITFPKPYGTLEAFYTSGGVSTLVKTLHGKVKNLDYKTIRYVGHQARIKLLMDLGLFDETKLACGCSPRDITEHQLATVLASDDPDLILMRVWGVGRRNGKRTVISHDLIDLADEKTGLSAMMRCTCFPATIIAGMILRQEVTERGVLRQEEHVPVPRLIDELAKRGVLIKRRSRTV